MKIKIAFTGDELTKAQRAAKALLVFFPKDTKARFSSRHKPFYHIYIADRAGRSDSKRTGSGSRAGKKRRSK